MYDESCTEKPTALLSGPPSFGLTAREHGTDLTYGQISYSSGDGSVETLVGLGYRCYHGQVNHVDAQPGVEAVFYEGGLGTVGRRSPDLLTGNGRREP
ncbi:hypothetical protein E4U53_005138, partial [Claviceps sorghi]